MSSYFCPNCGKQVIPTSDGSCPSCQAGLPQERSETITEPPADHRTPEMNAGDVEHAKNWPEDASSDSDGLELGSEARRELLLRVAEGDASAASKISHLGLSWYDVSVLWVHIYSLEQEARRKNLGGFVEAPIEFRYMVAAYARKIARDSKKSIISSIIILLMSGFLGVFAITSRSFGSGALALIFFIIGLSMFFHSTHSLQVANDVKSHLPEDASKEYDQALAFASDSSTGKVPVQPLPPSSGKPVDGLPDETPIVKADTHFRRLALEASLLVTLLAIIGTLILLGSVFLGTDMIGDKIGKAFTALVTGLVAWFSIRAVWDYYRSKDERKRHSAFEFLNMWGFLLIGLVLTGGVLGLVWAKITPINFTIPAPIGRLIGVIVVGGWIYWAVRQIFKK